MVESTIREYVSLRFSSFLPLAIMTILSLREKRVQAYASSDATADPKQMEIEMLIVETLQRPPAGTNISERVHVRHAAAKQTETRAEELESDITNAELAARAIEARVSEMLQASSYYAVRHVSCEVRTRLLILRGRVPSYFLKQVAQTIVRAQLSDGLVIDNRVEVDRT